MNRVLLCRDGLAARSLCIPLSATGRGGLQESLARASRAAQSGLRARQKDLEVSDDPDFGTDADAAGAKQPGHDQPASMRKSLSSASQQIAGIDRPNGPLNSQGQAGAGAQTETEVADTEQGCSMQEQHRTGSTPLPTAGTTPESLPSDRKGPSGGSDSPAQMQHVDLFQQLGPRPLQSLAAIAFAKDPAHQAAPADQGSQPEEMKSNTSDSAHKVPNGAEEAALDTLAEPSMHFDTLEGRDSADRAGAGQGGRTSQQGAKQARDSMPPAVPVVPEASAAGSPHGAKKGTRGEPLRRSLLPAVHPRFRSSPLRTPAVNQSLSMLPDQATTAQSEQSQGPGSADVVISSSWDRSAKQVMF